MQSSTSCFLSARSLARGRRGNTGPIGLITAGWVFLCQGVTGVDIWALWWRILHLLIPKMARFLIASAWLNRKIMVCRQKQSGHRTEERLPQWRFWTVTGMSNERMQEVLFKAITGYFISSLTSILQQSIKALCPQWFLTSIKHKRSIAGVGVAFPTESERCLSRNVFLFRDSLFFGIRLRGTCAYYRCLRVSRQNTPWIECQHNAGHTLTHSPMQPHTMGNLKTPINL